MISEREVKFFFLRLLHFLTSSPKRLCFRSSMIQEDWVTSNVSAPEMIEERQDDERHYLKRIPEHAGKFLRVIVNHSVHPPRVITVFFDRRVQP